MTYPRYTVALRKPDNALVVIDTMPAVEMVHVLYPSDETYNETLSLLRLFPPISDNTLVVAWLMDRDMLMDMFPSMEGKL